MSAQAVKAAAVLTLLADHKDAQAAFRKLHLGYQAGELSFERAGPLFVADQARRVELEHQFDKLTSQQLRDLATALTEGGSS
ncbi:hypothetical protein GCM10022631_11900 [Deinococcus rubellus]|uniref:Uncharacterized protein n=1 Tax=Deinococcus rubellus TaxID=1889240 RepID=A0ABY5YCJ0_9DEIO|nr:hypothetical protein [Deinococcus rubellus]UWX62764.1 hypothetical protein N0D28_08255 [Deinococcus rubellus]